jgi:peptide/nickel transport system permease protein
MATLQDSRPEHCLPTEPVVRRSHWVDLFVDGWVVFRENLIGRIGLILLFGFALMALCSYIPPLIDAMYHPMTGVDPLISGTSAPSMRHWLGTDFIGRDILSQLLAGARIAFMVGLSAAFMSIVLGTGIGMVSGYAGGILDTLLMRLADMIMVMPTLAGGADSLGALRTAQHLDHRAAHCALFGGRGCHA